MALSFKKNSAEAIAFGDLVATPNVDIEARLRIQGLQMGNANEIKEAILVISECFGDKKDEVAEFLSKDMTVLDLAKLKAYLVGGDDMVERVNSAMDGAFKGVANE